MPFTFKKMDIPDVLCIIPKIYTDSRGYFTETYKESDFLKNGISDSFIQDNTSQSLKGVVRGLHYQINPVAQAKLVRCIYGKVFDVAVDIRKGSPTFGKWISCELSSDNNYLLYLPEGFAHGFLTLSEKALVTYKVSAEYAPDYERGIIYNDSKIAIKWPTNDILLSEKDALFPGFTEADIFD